MPDAAPIHQAHDSDFTASRLLAGLAIGAAVIGAGIILAPHILPALGVTESIIADEALHAFPNPSGWAKTLNALLAGVPVVGTQLASGGLFNAAATGIVGIGGTLLGNFIANNEDGSKQVKWGNVIKYAALTTSALIALPTVLSALSAGIAYCAIALSDANVIANAGPTINAMYHSLGTIGKSAHTLAGASGLIAALPHLITCGVSFVPAALTAHAWHKHGEEKAADFAERITSSSALAQPYSDGSIVADIRLDAPLEPGKNAHVTLTLTHHSGTPLTAEELAVVHTEKIHLFIADGSLKDYHHLHPVPTGAPGEFGFSFTPKSGGHYAAWTDVTTAHDGKNHKLKTLLRAENNRTLPASIRGNARAASDTLEFSWSTTAPLRQDMPAIVEIAVRGKDGSPARDLEPVMGAFAHLVGFSADGESLVHCHPLGQEPSHAGDRGGPNLRFHIEPDTAGPTQFYLQIKREGRDIYVPFGQQVATARQPGESRYPAFAPAGSRLSPG